MASPPRYTLRAIIVVQAIAAVIMLFTRLWGWTAFLACACYLVCAALGWAAARWVRDPEVFVALLAFASPLCLIAFWSLPGIAWLPGYEPYDRAPLVFAPFKVQLTLASFLCAWMVFLVYVLPVRRMLQRHRLESRRVAFWLALQGAGVLSFLGLLPLRFALFPIAPP
ncbi:MAG: hypothetical protein WD403_02235 [Pirellulales bacterium]